MVKFEYKGAPCTSFVIGCVVGVLLINHLNVFHARVALLSDISLPIIQCH